MDTYASRGFHFDRILAWEAQRHAPQDIFAQYPTDVFGRVSYYNIPADPEEGARGNPLRVLKQLTRKEDFVVIKIDIDNDPVELAFIQQILHDPAISELIDELYFEHHVSGHPLHKESWGAAQKLMNMSQSYTIFSRLRELGIRAHSWV